MPHSSQSQPVRETVLEQCRKPFPASRKIHVQGSRPDLQVPLREVTLNPTRALDGNLTSNEPVRLYDTTGPYTDPAATIDLPTGLAPLRLGWIQERGDVEELERPTSYYRQLRERDAELDAIRFRPSASPFGPRPERT